MNSTWMNLLWKEWREHRWKLAALTGILVVVPALCSLVEPDDIWGALAATMMVAVPLGSMFVGMGTAASEQSRGTIRFLQALPAPYAKAAAAKLLMSAITVTAPVVVAAGFAYAWVWLFVGAGNENNLVSQDLTGSVWAIGDWRLALVAAGCIGAVSVLIWMAAIGVNRSDEIRAGAYGMLAIVTVWALLGFIQVKVTRPGQSNPRWYRIVSAAAPGGAWMVNEQRYSNNGTGWWAANWPALAVALASNGALAGWFVGRFGRVGAGRRQVVGASAARTSRGWLGPPRSRPATAILWKQCRETLPLAAMGAGVILALNALMLLTPWTDDRARMFSPDDMLSLSVVLWIIVGGFVAIVSGIGVFMDDLSPRLNFFWRSRPVAVDQWFALKFVAGLLLTVVVMSVPPLVVGAYLGLRYEQADVGGWIPTVGMAALSQAGIYCAGVAAIAILRQPVYAAIAAVGAIVLAATAGEKLDRYFHLQGTELAIAGMIGLGALAAALAAWAAVRNDWGWKG